MVIPITIYHYNTLAVFSILLSILASFIVAPIIFLGLICLIFDSPIVQFLLSDSLKILIFISKLGAKIPLNKIYMITPNILMVIIYYFIVFLSSSIFKMKLEKDPSPFQIRIKNLVSLAKYRINQNKSKVISVLLIICVIFSLYFSIPKDLRIYFIDVGQRRLHSYCNPKKSKDFN